jgi:hypothetical protein
MLRIPLLLLTTLLLALTVTGAAEARIPIRVGISEQQPTMFDQTAFKHLHVRHVRYFAPWNVMTNRNQRLLARTYVKRARAAGDQVLLHLSTDDYRSKHGHLPSVREYRTQVRRLVAYFRHLGVRDFGVWNEANHASEPTYRSPARAADFFREMYRAVKGRCRSCGVVALDVLDQRGVEKYIRSFFRHLSPTYRRRATIIGLHNYGDVNRRRTRYTRSMIRQAHVYSPHARIWLTETGGLVKLGTSFPYSPTRAAHRLSTMFSLANRFRHSGIDRLYVYNWTGTGRDARFDAGLTDPDGTPRPGYTYLRKKLAGYLR